MVNTPQTSPEWLARRLRYRQSQLRERVNTADGLALAGEVTIRAFDAARLRAQWPDWPTLPDAAKLARLEAGAIEPLERHTTTNTATDGHAQYLVENLDPGQSVNTGISHVALGDDGSTSPTSSNTQLNNEFAQIAVGSVTDNTDTLSTSTVLGTGDQNGNTIAEVGLRDGSTTSDRLFNHSLVGPVNKNSSKEVTIDIDLVYIP